MFTSGCIALYKQQYARIAVIYYMVFGPQYHWCSPLTAHVLGKNISV